MGRKLQDMFAYYGLWQPKRPLPSTTCFSTKTRPFPIPWLVLTNSEPNISRIYTPQIQSWVSVLRSTPMKMERIVSSETSALKAQTPEDYPTHGESLKSRFMTISSNRRPTRTMHITKRNKVKPGPLLDVMWTHTTQNAAPFGILSTRFAVDEKGFKLLRFIA